jgi:hypothetical protein
VIPVEDCSEFSGQFSVEIIAGVVVMNVEMSAVQIVTLIESLFNGVINMERMFEDRAKDSSPSYLHSKVNVLHNEACELRDSFLWDYIGNDLYRGEIKTLLQQVIDSCVSARKKILDLPPEERKDERGYGKTYNFTDFYNRR